MHEMRYREWNKPETKSICPEMSMIKTLGSEVSLLSLNPSTLALIVVP